MRRREWKKLQAMVAKLTFAQRRALKEELAAENDAAACVEVIETEGKPSGCPHCRSELLVRNGSAYGLQRYKCRSCHRTFNALTGTPLARLRQKPKWLAQAEALRDGTTITQAATRLKVARSTAFRWRHRFLALPKTVQAQALKGIAEADETFFLHSRKGQRQLDRKPRRRGGRAAKRGLSKEQVPVLVARARAGVAGLGRAGPAWPCGGTPPQDGLIVPTNSCGAPCCIRAAGAPGFFGGRHSWRRYQRRTSQRHPQPTRR